MKMFAYCLLMMGPMVSGVPLFAEARSGELIQPIEPVEIKEPNKVSLGKMLYFDPRLSKSAVISCNTCHNLSTAGVDNREVSIGHNWQRGGVNSPTVLNSSLHFVQFWDGRAKDLREQAVGPIQNPIEMAGSHKLSVETISSIPGYEEPFKKAFGDKKVTIDRIADAIAAFEETLVTPNSPFDLWLKGDDKAISKDALKGYELFKGKGCIACHMGPAVGGNQFQKFGLVHEYTKDKVNLGRFGVTKNEADKFWFKVPSLRNVELTYPYFHDGSVWTLEEAVDIMSWHQLGIKLEAKERGAIVAFLKSLTAPQLKIELPILPPSVAKTPRPER